ncbi:MAG: GGDEF domain-containing protein [Planctomycetota bacterium]
MTPPLPTTESRLLVVADVQRLGPVVADCFAPQRIEGVHSYLEAVAEIPRSPTRAVLVGHDLACRKPEAAMAAMKSVAGEAPVVFCCEPAHEQVGRRLLNHGADDYVIFPPDSIDLERALRIPSRRTQRRWTETPIVAPTPSVEELARLADVLPMLAEGSPAVLDAMASLICTALNSESATVVLAGRTGRASLQPTADFDGILVEPIVLADERVGQIRVGPRCAGGYTHEDTAKLRHYAVLFARMHDTGRRSEAWRLLSNTDDLTGLPNRRQLLDFLNRTLAEARDTRSTVTALVFDIDDFKRFNDTYGHDAGDEILRDVGQLFVNSCRKGDMVARYGGDEFVVVFWSPEGPRVAGSQHPEGIVTVLQRFREALRKHSFPRLGPEAVGHLTISGGLAHFPWQAQSAEHLIEAADEALLSAKRAGKNRFWVVGSGSV